MFYRRSCISASEGPIPLHNLHSIQPNKCHNVCSFPQLHSSRYPSSCSKGIGSQTPALKEGFAFLVFSPPSPKQSLAKCLLLFPPLHTLILAEEKIISSLLLSAHTGQMACAGALLCFPLSPNIRQSRQQDPGCIVLLPVSPSRDILLMPGPEPDLIWRYLAWKLPQKVKAMGDPRSFSWQQGGSSAVTFILRKGFPSSLWLTVLNS